VLAPTFVEGGVEDLRVMMLDIFMLIPLLWLQVKVAGAGPSKEEQSVAEVGVKKNNKVRANF
jgi:hypothetical protein